MHAWFFQMIKGLLRKQFILGKDFPIRRKKEREKLLPS
jgi:hypothetical protein